MDKLKQYLKKLPEPISYSLEVIKTGILLFAGYILIACVMHILSFTPEYYLRTQVVFRGALENGAGCLASAVIGALLCDIICKCR